MVLVCINAYFMSTYCCIICDQVFKYFSPASCKDVRDTYRSGK